MVQVRKTRDILLFMKVDTTAGALGAALTGCDSASPDMFVWSFNSSDGFVSQIRSSELRTLVGKTRLP